MTDAGSFGTVAAAPPPLPAPPLPLPPPSPDAHPDNPGLWTQEDLVTVGQRCFGNRALAGLLGVSRGTIYNWKVGREMPRCARVLMIAMLLDRVSPAEAAEWGAVAGVSI